MYTDISWTLYTSPTPVTVTANLNLMMFPLSNIHILYHTHNGHNVHHILHYHTDLRLSVYLIVYRQNELQQLCERIFWAPTDMHQRYGDPSPPVLFYGIMAAGTKTCHNEPYTGNLRTKPQNVNLQHLQLPTLAVSTSWSNSLK